MESKIWGGIAVRECPLSEFGFIARGRARVRPETSLSIASRAPFIVRTASPARRYLPSVGPTDLTGGTEVRGQQPPSPTSIQLAGQSGAAVGGARA